MGAYESSYDTEDGQYEHYREPDLPEGYTAYRQNRNADEYDQYESHCDDRPESETCEFKSCCNDIGRLV